MYVYLDVIQPYRMSQENINREKLREREEGGRGGGNKNYFLIEIYLFFSLHFEREKKKCIIT